MQLCDTEQPRRWSPACDDISAENFRMLEASNARWQGKRMNNKYKSFENVACLLLELRKGVVIIRVNELRSSKR